MKNVAKGAIATGTLLTITASAIMGFAGYTMLYINSVASKVTAVETVNASQGERISATESTTKEINARLDRIETKLDTVIRQTK